MDSRYVIFRDLLQISNLTSIVLESPILSNILTDNCASQLFHGDAAQNQSDECLNQFEQLHSVLVHNSSSHFNSSSTDSPSENQPFVPTLWMQLFWTLIFAIMVLVAVIGNIIIIIIVLAHRRMRTVTNFFLLNLTIADLATAIFNAIFNFVFMLYSHWPFGHSYCVINNFIANLTIASSVFTITATSIDR